MADETNDTGADTKSKDSKSKCTDVKKETPTAIIVTFIFGGLVVLCCTIIALVGVKTDATPVKTPAAQQAEDTTADQAPTSSDKAPIPAKQENP